MPRDTPWNRAVKWPATFGGRAEQLRRAVELPSGKVVEFVPPSGARVVERDCAEIIIRQTVPVRDGRDPREVGY